MKLLKSTLTLTLGILLASTGVGRAEEAAAFPQFVRPLGMGGAFTAVADDSNVFSFNPAGMVQRKGAELTVLELALGGSKDFKDSYDYLGDNEDELTNLEDTAASDPARAAQIVNDTNNFFRNKYPRLYVAGNVASYVSGPSILGLPFHLGFGALTVADGSFRIQPGPTFPNVSYAVNNDVVVPLSIAKRFDAPLIPGRIGIGITGKFIRRLQVAQENLSVAQMEDLETPDPATGRAMGTDVGLLYQPTDRINIGVMTQDFLGTKMHFDAVGAQEGVPAQSQRDTVIRPRTNIGVALYPEKLFWLLPTGNRLTLAVDVRDVMAKDKHILFENGFKKPFGEDAPTHIYAGAEYKYWFMRFRGGAYQGYPTLGLGIDLPILKIDYAFYSQELGARAGNIRQQNHVVSLGFKFGTNYTEARERIVNQNQSNEERKMAVPETTPSAVPASTNPPADAAPPAAQ